MRLDRELEAWRGALDPGGHRARRRHPVEGDVQLDRRKLARVIRQPVALGQAGRVKRAAPVLIRESGRANLNHAWLP
jgi:hypothetical protein